MASSGSGYDLSSSTFSPDGRIFQVEYASKAVENAGSALGLKCRDGVVLCVEKPILNKMLLPNSSRRIHTIDTHSGVAITGFVSDGRQLVNRAREEASNYEETYGSKIPPSVLAERLAAYVHYFTLHGSLRPFGTTALVASYDPDTKEHSLHMVEPSGSSFKYFGCAAGKGRQPCRTEMEKLALNKADPSENITVREGVKQLARMIYSIYEEGKDKPFEIEMSWLCEESGWEHKGVPRGVISEAVEWAKQDIADSEIIEESDDDEEMVSFD
jgi:20S proteasome subunit alpha 7